MDALKVDRGNRKEEKSGLVDSELAMLSCSLIALAPDLLLRLGSGVREDPE
jgi:hypothetical protein